MTPLEIEIKLIDAYWGFYDRQYNEHIAPLVWLMKIGTISQPTVKHNNPLDYGLTDKDAINMRIRHLKGLKSSLESELSDKKARYLRGENEFGYIGINSITERLDKLARNIHFLKARLKGEVVNQQFDLGALKRVPMNSICRINNNGFFQVNPFRTEKEPSNSLFYYKKDNRCQDFATGKSYDVIDLYQAVNNCDFKTACKELNTML